jgi:hypothetical protein
METDKSIILEGMVEAGFPKYLTELLEAKSYISQSGNQVFTLRLELSASEVIPPPVEMERQVERGMVLKWIGRRFANSLFGEMIKQIPEDMSFAGKVVISDDKYHGMKRAAQEIGKYATYSHSD